jgi:hypothetical protein
MDLAQFPVTNKWPAKHPDRIQLYSLPTPNGVKISIAIMGDEYTIADIATFPWIRNLVGFYEARELVGFEDFPAVGRAFDAFLARPAVQRGLAIPAAPQSQ